MKRTLPLLALLLCLLAACSSSKDIPAEARLSLPDGACAKVCANIPKKELSLAVTVEDSAEARLAALTDGTADFALLSTEDAVALFQDPGGIQAVAVVATRSGSGTRAAECLVVRTDFATEHPDVLTRLFSLYPDASEDVKGALFSTEWDMVDMIQADCESRFSKQPDELGLLPDDSFYYFPATQEQDTP